MAQTSLFAEITVLTAGSGSSRVITKEEANFIIEIITDELEYVPP